MEKDEREVALLHELIIMLVKDTYVHKKMIQDLMDTVKMAGGHSGDLVAFVGAAIKRYPDLETIPEFGAIPEELQSYVTLAAAESEYLASNLKARGKAEKGGGGSENVQ